MILENSRFPFSEHVEMVCLGSRDRVYPSLNLLCEDSQRHHRVFCFLLNSFLQIPCILCECVLLPELYLKIYKAN